MPSGLLLLRTLVLLALLGATVCQAGGLYTAQVPVASQSDADRAEALKNALAQIVMRVSGDNGALAKGEVAKAVAGAERYVQQFHYEQDVAADAAGQAQERLTLVAQFDRDAVDQLLRNFGLLPDAGPQQPAAAVETTAPGVFHLWIGGVRSGRDYARLMGAFSGNEWVRDVQVEIARGDGVQLRLGAIGPLGRLLDVLNAGAVLRVTNAKPPVEGLDALLELKP